MEVMAGFFDGALMFLKLLQIFTFQPQGFGYDDFFAFERLKSGQVAKGKFTFLTVEHMKENHILLDASGSMGYSSGKVTKFECGRFIAGVLAYMLIGQQDATGMITFTSKIEKYLPARSTSKHLKNIFDTLDETKNRFRYPAGRRDASIGEPDPEAGDGRVDHRSV